MSRYRQPADPVYRVLPANQSRVDRVHRGASARRIGGLGEDGEVETLKPDALATSGRADQVHAIRDDKITPAFAAAMTILAHASASDAAW